MPLEEKKKMNRIILNVVILRWHQVITTYAFIYIHKAYGEMAIVYYLVDKSKTIFLENYLG